VLSGLHRITGLLLTLASLVLVGWLAAIASGAGAYALAAGFFGSWPVRIMLAGTLAVVWYHPFNGLRHLAWDAGFGFESRASRRSGALVVACTALAFAATLWLTPAGRWLAGLP
jgi:succinate dehydrogenase / fumarate reductase cytochrome b subunit